MRFNTSAERIWGWKADEVIGKNVKMLMPEEFSSRHDAILLRYMTTGQKHVIGSSRRVRGMKKDGSTFPLHLSVSEVKEEGTHWFTGIARDLTKDVEAEEAVKRRDAEAQSELEGLIMKLDDSKEKADGLLKQMLPPEISTRLLMGEKVPPQSFDEATVFFSDIVGFTTISSGQHPFAVVDLLQALYDMFDEVISTYDAYKVETIGDAYMVVSGVPKKNGKRHAAEIATMALHIASKLANFQVPGRPDVKVRVRIGLNSGPVVAGVVGTKMPRYCLFGDTVNTASRMESTGLPMKIQISETTYKYLKAAGGFHMQERGDLEVKGKGKMKTYFLTGKEDCPYTLPESDAA
jgi:PAS domain S-box-containing protein